MMKIRKLVAIPRSLFYSIKLFGVGGLKLPILISNNVKLKGLNKGSLEIVNKATCGVQIGFSGSEGISSGKMALIISKNSKLVFDGRAVISKGSSIRVSGGRLTIGNNFYMNKNCFISCSEKISIGENVLLGWNVNIRDSDGHEIIYNGESKKSIKPVIIGNHVWIASFSDILKGVFLPNDSVIGYRSCVTKGFGESHCLIVGCPAKVVRKNIDWNK